MSKSSVWRIVYRRRTEKIRKRKVQHGKSGRQKISLLEIEESLADHLYILREENPNFTVMVVVRRSGIPQHKACRTRELLAELPAREAHTSAHTIVRGSLVVLSFIMQKLTN